MNSNDEPDAAKTVSATDTPGVRGPAAARGGAAVSPNGAGVDDTAAPAGADVDRARADANDVTAADPATPDAADIGVDHAVASDTAGAANAPEAPAPAARTADTAHAVGVGADSAAPAAPVGTAVANGADPVDADSAGAGTAGPDAAGLGVDHASDTGSEANAPGTVAPATADTANAPAPAGTAPGVAGLGVGRVGATTGTPDTAGTAPAPGDVGDSVPARRLFWSTLGVALVLLLVDQASKWWAVGALGDSESIDVVGDVIRFWLVYNPGAAFSMGTGVTWVFTIFAGVAVVAIAWYAWRVRSTPWAYALGLLLGGATSHFGDRLFREPGFARGHVVDFIDYAGFFVGNVADIGIFAGAVTIVVLSFKGIEAVDRDPVDNPAD
ncbi:signal peptidase II [Streptomyces niveus]|uniref:signal peptidase II n=1 Tax=Streptomyces niveus TaxID=193462 RepID=UPI0036D32745